MITKIKQLFNRAKRNVQNFVQEERGDLGIGQIAAIVAGIVIIGVVISVITGLMDDWIAQVWTWVTELFDKIT